MNKLFFYKNFFKKHLTQCILLFILFIFLAIIFLNIPISKINTQLPEHVDAYLVSWIWSWEDHILLTDPLNFFNSNIFAPFENTLAYTEIMLGSFLLAWPILIIFNNPILAYSIVVLLTFAISGLGMYLLIYYLTKNKLAALLAALIYAFAPFKLIHSIGHLHLTGMWLPYVFLYLHKFFRIQTWKNILLLTLFVILVFLTGFHYFIFLPIIILVFFFTYYLSKSFRFNKDNIKKIILSLTILVLIFTPIILPFIQLKEEYNFVRSIETIEAYSPDLIDYLIPPVLYNYFYSSRSHMEMVVGPGLIIGLLFIFSLYYIFKKNQRIKSIQRNKTNFIIYFITASIAFIISFGFYIQFNSTNVGGIATFYSLFYYFIPGFDGIRAVGRYSIFVLLSITVFIGYGFTIYQQQCKNIFKKNIIYFLIIIFLFIELSLIPVVSYSEVKVYPNTEELFAWIRKQPPEKIFLNIPLGFRLNPEINLDIIHVFNSRLHFKRIVNGYSGQRPPNYDNLIYSLNISGPQKSLQLLEEFKVNYLIYYFDFYENPDEVRDWYINQLEQANNIKYVTNFGNNYVYEIVY